MEPDKTPDDAAIVQDDKRESVVDRFALLGLVLTLCIGFVLLVAAGYGVRALLRSFN